MKQRFSASIVLSTVALALDASSVRVMDAEHPNGRQLTGIAALVAANRMIPVGDYAPGEGFQLSFEARVGDSVHISSLNSPLLNVVTIYGEDGTKTSNSVRVSVLGPSSTPVRPTTTVPIQSSPPANTSEAVSDLERSANAHLVSWKEAVSQHGASDPAALFYLTNGIGCMWNAAQDHPDVFRRHPSWLDDAISLAKRGLVDAANPTDSWPYWKARLQRDLGISLQLKARQSGTVSSWSLHQEAVKHCTAGFYGLLEVASAPERTPGRWAGFPFFTAAALTRMAVSAGGFAATSLNALGRRRDAAMMAGMVLPHIPSTDSAKNPQVPAVLSMLVGQGYQLDGDYRNASKQFLAAAALIERCGDDTLAKQVFSSAVHVGSAGGQVESVILAAAKDVVKDYVGSIPEDFLTSLIDGGSLQDAVTEALNYSFEEGLQAFVESVIESLLG